MGRKTPEGKAKDGILLANGCVSVEELMLWNVFNGVITYTDKDGVERRYKTGANGIPDLGAILTMTITPEMVGKTIGVHCEFEVKRPDKPPKPTPEQKTRLKKVTKRGGIAGVVQKPEDVREILCKWVANLHKKP